jgi:hypothetical protein
MRKIEKMMLAAIDSGRDFELNNTKVIHDDGTVYVYLHGHNIAQRDPDGQYAINLCGYNTATTRSRLSAILFAYEPRINGVCTKQGQARIVYSDGHTVDISDTAWRAV